MVERIQMPQSGGGLVRYSEDYKTRIEIGPSTVIGIIIVVAIIELALHFIFK